MAQPHTHDGDHGHAAEDHGSFKSYMTGFVLAVILTVIPFAIVMAGGFESRALTITIVVLCAIAQVLVHMIYFLHMNSRSEEGWGLLSTMFTVVVIIIMLSGSLWVMFHLNQNMMPQMRHETQGMP